MKKSSHHFYTEKDIKNEYKFWDSQLVPKFHENSSITLGPIKSQFKEEEIKDPIKLPEKEMKWVLIGPTKENELKKIYDF